MQAKPDHNEDNIGIYQFEDIVVDIIQPRLVEDYPQETTANKEELSIQRQLRTLKETYILTQKPQQCQVNMTKRKLEAKKLKRLKTLKNFSAKNSQREKQNIEMLFEERNHREFQQRLSLLHQVKAPLECLIEVEKAGMFNCQPIYRLFSASQSKFLLSCQKEGLLTSRHIFSMHPKRICAQEKSYFGQIASLNFRGNEWMAYDQGFHPNKVREIQDCRTQLLYAKFKSSCGVTNNNQIKILIPSNVEEIDQYKQFQGQANILDRYSIQQPSRVQECYYVREDISEMFRKKIFDIPVLGNFVVVPLGSSTPILYFGKRGEGKFMVEVHPPLSVFQAFTICTLHMKITDI